MTRVLKWAYTMSCRNLIRLFLGTVLLLFAGATAHAATEYRLGVGDQLRIKVYEWPDLSGEFSVGSNGSVFLMLIGEVEARGLTVSELAADISQRLEEQARLIEAPSATVEVIEHRPFYVLGDVQRPGSYPYRPGLTVLQAVSMAGGFRRAPEGGVRPQRDAITSRGQLALLQLKIDQLSARQARLAAEQEEYDSIEFPPFLTERRDEPHVQRLMQEERLLFRTYRDQRDERSAVLQLLKDFYEAEAESMTEQLEDVRAQVESAREHLEQVTSLVAQGLAPSPRQLDMERTVVTMVGNQRQLETNILRAQQSAAEAQQRLLDLHWERRNRIVLEGQQTQAEQQKAWEELATTRQLLLEALASEPEGAQASERGAPETTYEIVRTADGVEQSFEAEEPDPVEPGDALKVRRSLELGLPQVPSLRTMPGLSGHDGEAMR